MGWEIIRDFRVIKEDGRIIQECVRCRKYKSPTILNEKPFEISAGMRMHMLKKHYQKV